MKSAQPISRYRRGLSLAAALPGCLVLLGCMHSPSFNVLGSYFPAWVACLVLGILLTVMVRWVINKIGFDRRLPLPPLFYFSLTLLFACVLWLIGFE